ncbi:MAG: hypothetical protein Tsb0027_23120 [Wenzhouxiangellaceae bacterium]
MTIICNSQRFIFVHLHKCGGTSVRQAIRTQMRWNDLIIGGNNNDNLLESIYRRRYALEKHNSASQLQRIVGDDIWRSYWTFALVRHPASIMASYYHWTRKVLQQLAQRHGLRADQVVASIRAGDIDDPVLAWDAVQAYCHCDGQTDSLAGFIEHALEHGVLGFGQTLSERLTDADGRLVDAVYQLEQLQQLEQDFTARTGIEMTLGHANRSQQQAQKQAWTWDVALLDKIWQRYREDYARFGYDKQPPPAQ